MYRDEFKARYTTIPMAIYRAYCSTGKKSVLSHCHREIEIISVLEGLADFYIDADHYKVEKGDILIIPPYATHCAETALDVTTAYTCICFDLSLICDEELQASLEKCTLSIRRHISGAASFAGKLREYVENGCRACEIKDAGWEFEAIGNMSLFFGILKKEQLFYAPPAAKINNLFALTVLNHISDNYAAPITSRSTAAVLHIDQSYFCRLFKKTFGCCFSDYLLSYRLEKAKRSLENPNATAAEVSACVGFNNYNYFGKSFKNHFGVSPRTFHKQFVTSRETV